MQPILKLEKTKFQNGYAQIWTLDLEHLLMIGGHINPRVSLFCVNIFPLELEDQFQL